MARVSPSRLVYYEDNIYNVKKLNWFQYVEEHKDQDTNVVGQISPAHPNICVLCLDSDFRLRPRAIRVCEPLTRGRFHHIPRFLSRVQLVYIRRLELRQKNA
jgi:hypothetical protein